MKQIKTKELFHPSGISHIDEFVFSKEYPWELLPLIKEYVQSLIEKGIPGYTKLKEDVLIGQNVKIAETADITGPAIIGNDVEIRPGCYIRGSLLVGDGCVLGNSCEFKNAILMKGCQVPHFSYVGDSILGNYAHMGAGSICSNLRSDGKPVIIHGEIDIPTGIRKVGAFLGDHADIGCQSVLNPGTIVGQNAQVYPLTMTRGVYPSGSIVKKTDLVVKKENKE